MVNEANEICLPRYNCLYREQTAAEGLYILLDGTLDQSIGAEGSTIMRVSGGSGGEYGRSAAGGAAGGGPPSPTLPKNSRLARQSAEKTGESTYVQPIMLTIGNEVLTNSRCGPAHPTPPPPTAPPRLACLAACHMPHAARPAARSVASSLVRRSDAHLAAMCWCRRKATVRALCQCQLLQFPRTALGLSEDDIRREYVREVLPMIPCFAGLDAATSEKLRELIQYRDYNEGYAPTDPNPESTPNRGNSTLDPDPDPDPEPRRTACCGMLAPRDARSSALSWPHTASAGA